MRRNEGRLPKRGAAWGLVPVCAVLVAAALHIMTALPACAETVFVVDSYHGSYPWSSECRQGLLEGLMSGVKTQFYELDTKRRSEAEVSWRLEAAWKACNEARPDLVVLMDDNALRHLGPRMSDAGYPIVFMGINGNPRRYFHANSIPYNVSGVLERPLLMRSVKYLGEFIDVMSRRFLVMMDDAYTSEAIIDSSLGGRRELLVSGFEVETFLAGSYEVWKRRVLNLDKARYDAIILGSYAALRDETGRQVPLDDVTQWTARNSSVPVFCFWNFSVGKGKAIGGLLIDGGEQGREAARMVNRYLVEGEMPVLTIPEQGSLVFSRYELARWGLVLPERMKCLTKMVE